jgi:hypothetical protein
MSQNSNHNNPIKSRYHNMYLNSKSRRVKEFHGHAPYCATLNTGTQLAKSFEAVMEERVSMFPIGTLD